MNLRGNKQQKTSLLHLIYSLRLGGAEVALSQYIRAFGTEQYDHHVYCLVADGPVRKKIEPLGIPVTIGTRRASIKKPIQFGLSVYSQLSDLLTYSRVNRIQIIQSHMRQPNQLAVMLGKLARLPVFPTVHSTMAFVDTRNRFDFRVHLNTAVDSFIYRLADRVIAVSQEVKEVTCRRYNLNTSKVIVVNNGVFRYDCPLYPINIEREFPSSDGKLKLIAVGRLVGLKGFETLIKAVAEVVDQGLANLLVLIAGEGEERQHLESLIKSLGLETYIRLLGLRNDVMSLMSACDFFVMPSHYEGLSMAMIEAMACSLPTIASDAPGIRNHVRNDENGLLFPTGDYKALANQIFRLANDRELMSKLSLGARRTFEKDYDLRENIKPLHFMFQKYTLAKGTKM